MKKIVINCETNEEELIPLTQEEIVALGTVQHEPTQTPNIDQRLEALEEALLILLG